MLKHYLILFFQMKLYEACLVDKYNNFKLNYIDHKSKSYADR